MLFINTFIACFIVALANVQKPTFNKGEPKGVKAKGWGKGVIFNEVVGDNVSFGTVGDNVVFDKKIGAEAEFGDIGKDAKISMEIATKAKIPSLPEKFVLKAQADLDKLVQEQSVKFHKRNVHVTFKKGVGKGVEFKETVGANVVFEEKVGDNVEFQRAIGDDAVVKIEIPSGMKITKEITKKAIIKDVKDLGLEENDSTKLGPGLSPLIAATLFIGAVGMWLV